MAEIFVAAISSLICLIMLFGMGALLLREKPPSPKEVERFTLSFFGFNEGVEWAHERERSTGGSSAIGSRSYPRRTTARIKQRQQQCFVVYVL